MTEEIIINGVNVAECINFVGCNMCNDFLDGQCEGHNCEYKQLKRLEQEHNTICYNLGLLEQENENLKKEVKKIGSDFIKKGDYARELEQENRELKAYKDVNEDFKKAWDELNRKYTEVLELAKTNADSNEYCLQELEKENKELEEKLNAFVEHSKTESDKVYYKMLDYETALEEIRTYLNTLSSIDSDFTSTETYLRIQNKINEVLK